MTKEAKVCVDMRVQLTHYLHLRDVAISENCQAAVQVYSRAAFFIRRSLLGEGCVVAELDFTPSGVDAMLTRAAIYKEDLLRAQAPPETNFGIRVHLIEELPLPKPRALRRKTQHAQE